MEASNKDDTIVRFSLRLSPTLHRELGEYAKEEHRSLHAQIIDMLEAGIKERKEKNAQNLPAKD